MTQLLAVAPELVADLMQALAGEGRADLAKQLESAQIERITYDEPVDAGKIYLVRPQPSWFYEKLSAPVAETIPIELTLFMDVDHDGNLFGIEFLGRPDVIAKLRSFNAR